jgi:hypothetical protein
VNLGWVNKVRKTERKEINKIRKKEKTCVYLCSKIQHRHEGAELLSALSDRILLYFGSTRSCHHDTHLLEAVAEPRLENHLEERIGGMEELVVT